MSVAPELPRMFREFLRLDCPTVPKVKAEQEKPRPSWKQIARQADPRKIWRQVRGNPRERTRLAVAVAVGVFVSTLPAYGYHTLLAFFLARRLKLNSMAAVVGSHFSTPPIGQFQWIASIWLGHLMLTGRCMGLSDFDPAHRSLAHIAGWTLVEWTLGGLVLGIGLSVASFLLLLCVLHLIRLKGQTATPPGCMCEDNQERNR